MAPDERASRGEWWCHWRSGDIACLRAGPYDGYCFDHTRYTVCPADDCERVNPPNGQHDGPHITRRFRIMPPCTCPDDEIAHRLNCPAGAS